MRRGYLPTSTNNGRIFYSSLNNLHFRGFAELEANGNNVFLCYKDIKDVFKGEKEERNIFEVRMNGNVKEEGGYLIGKKMTIVRKLPMKFIWSYLKSRHISQLAMDAYYDPKYNFGLLNTSSFNVGNQNTGCCNFGNNNAGRYNCGNYNTGNFNHGDYNSGSRNAGDYNAGEGNYGRYNIGDFNFGISNTGGYNIGDFNTGSYNIGDKNSGYFNFCSYSTGVFNTKDGFLVDPKDPGSYKICIMDEQSKLTIMDARTSSWFEVCLRIIKEEYKNPYHKYITDIIPVWQIQCLYSIPNLKNENFEKIMGWSLENGKQVENKRREKIIKNKQMRQSIW